MEFSEKVYGLCKQIPQGKISTYKIIAEKLGTKAYRAVGQALKHNPDAPRIPCHRVVSSSGRIGGFKGKASGNAIEDKINLLKKERVIVKNKKIKNFIKVLHKF